ncbi:MAG: M28 family peptidase, partial [Planctomycetota bacterium]
KEQEKQAKVIAADKSEIDQPLAPARPNEKGKFKLEKVPSGYGPSDHQSFYQSGVPVLFFFTGLHNDYHRPSDDFDKINFKGLSRITDIVSEVTLELATDPQRPEYAETEKSGQN